MAYVNFIMEMYDLPHYVSELESDEVEKPGDAQSEVAAVTKIFG